MRRAAIIVPGGVGSGLCAQGIPALSALITDLAARHSVTVYSLTAAAGDFQPSGFRLRCRPSAHVSRSGILALLATIVADHRHAAFDVFHGFWAMPAGGMAVLLGKLLRRPSIVSLQGGEAAAIDTIDYGDMLHPRTRARTLAVCGRASALTALTQFQLDALRRHGFRRADVGVIPYGADAGLFPFTPRSLVEPLRFLHVANLTEVKDQTTLLDAFQRIRRKVDATLEIVGADYLGGRLQEEVAILGLSDRVTFAGFKPHTELPALFGDAHCLLHTSLYEGQSVVAMEAALSGTLVCGTRTGIFMDWRSHGFVTAEVGQAGALADAVVDVVKSPDRYASMITMANARAAARNRAWTAAQYHRLYAAL